MVRNLFAKPGFSFAFCCLRAPVQSQAQVWHCLSSCIFLTIAAAIGPMLWLRLLTWWSCVLTCSAELFFYCLSGLSISIDQVGSCMLFGDLSRWPETSMHHWLSGLWIGWVLACFLGTCHAGLSQACITTCAWLCHNWCHMVGQRMGLDCNTCWLCQSRSTGPLGPGFCVSGGLHCWQPTAGSADALLLEAPCSVCD